MEPLMMVVRPKFATPKPITHQAIAQVLYLILPFVSSSKYSLAELIRPSVVVMQARKNALPRITTPTLPK